CLVGNKYLPCPLPEKLELEQYEAIYSTSHDLGLKADLLDTWYSRDDTNYILRQPRKKTIDVRTEEWRTQSQELQEVIQCAAKELAANELRAGPIKFRHLTYSAVERQFSHALAVIRDWEKLEEGQAEFQDFDSEGQPHKRYREQLKNFRDRLAASLPNENRAYLAVPWKPGGLDPESEEHEAYLNKFREIVSAKLQSLINRSLEEEPEIKARNKTVQEVFQETLSHLALCQQQTSSDETVDWTGTDILERIRNLMTTSYETSAPGTRHGPILVHGSHGTGKSSLIGAVYSHCESWFGRRLLRIVRFSGATPRSAYNLELLRIICQQLCLLLHLSDGFLPKDASFDPLYVNNWFQTLIRRFEESATNELLVILIDDLHRLNPLDSDIRERFRNPDCYIEILSAPETMNFRIPLFAGVTVLEQKVESSLDELESLYGRLAVSRLAGFLTCSEFGLSETELLELLMPTSNSSATLTLSSGNYNFSTLCAVRRRMGFLFRLLYQKLMSGKMLICWRHELTSEVARKRYLQSQDSLRSTHGEVANLFFSEFSQQGSESEYPTSPTENKETPFQTTLQLDDVTYSLRHVEESWIHLLKAGDSNRLKQLTVCNFDFLLAAVQTVSVSYLRCVLEHVRCYLLDRDLELVYYTIRKSSDVLTRDPLQLGAQVICWLRPVAEHILFHMITSAMAWCDGFTAPLLVPLNGWLQPPLPLQIKSLHCPAGVKLIEPTPSGQHVVVIPQTGDPQLWHVMSNSLTHTFKGHSGPVLCLAITKQSQYLLTGSEDISIIVWDLKSLNLKLRIYEHIAPVLSLTPALNNSVIVSGGEDSRIIITSLLTGDVVMKIDHHRGPVTSVKVNTAGDVLVSGSSDSTICLWSLENFNLLNTISLPYPITMLDVSSDSVFLMAACEDNQLYLRSLATGTEIHSLRGHKAEIRSVCLAQDNCRAVVGGSDGKIYIYDMHSGRLSRTLTSHATDVSGVKVTEKDDFLLTAGGNRITFWSFRREDAIGPTSDGLSPVSNTRKTSQQSQQPHTAPITCLDVSRDGLMAVTGSVDSLVNVWQLNTHELHSTLEGHFASVTCVAFSPNGLFAVSGSEDKTARVWGLTLGLVVSTFKGHQATVTAVAAMMDSRRVVSSDRQGVLAVWVADNATLLHSCIGPGMCLAVTNKMKYAVCGNGDNSIRIWSVNREDERFTVSHSEEITCFVLTMDSLHVITGSRDMSLKVWQVAGGKLAQ
ncbi:hypothetical protein L9F63_022204, partial [Diploptera punctata]